MRLDPLRGGKKPMNIADGYGPGVGVGVVNIVDAYETGVGGKDSEHYR